MTLESALNRFLSELSGLPAFWLERPASAENAIVYRCISPGFIAGNLRPTGICEDAYTISVYHTDADQGKAIADALARTLEGFGGELNPKTEWAYPIQLASFSGGFDQALLREQGQRAYQFNRDFVINH